MREPDPLAVVTALGARDPPAETAVAGRRPTA
jgi:hypothetical protein